MKIKRLKINAYGKIKEKTIDFHGGINVIQGENESGKSTILHFITDMLYGISKNKEGKTISDYEKYKPWVGEEYSGKIAYELDNGENFEIYRDFKSKNPKIYNENKEDISSQYNIDKKEGNQFFLEQTEVDKSMYLSTSVAMQENVKLDGKDQNVLVQKIANIVGTGEDNISYKKAHEKLQNKIRDEIGTSKTSQKPLNILEHQVDEVTKEIDQIKLLEERKYSIETEKEEILDQIQTAKQEKIKLDQLREIENQCETIQQKIKILQENQLENNQKIESLQQRKQQTEKIAYEAKIFTDGAKHGNNKLIRGKICLLIILICSVVVFITSLFLKNVWVTIGSSVTVFLDLAGIGILNVIRKKHKNDNDNSDKLQNYQQESVVIQGQIDLLQENNQKLEAQEQQEKNEINRMISQLQGESSIKERMTTINQQLEDIRNQYNKLELEESIVFPKFEKLVVLKEQKSLLEEKIHDLKEQSEVIQIAITALEDAYEEMKTTITPLFTQKLSESIAEITHGKYVNVTINDEKGIIVENEEGEYIDINQFSTGTIEELYLSLRLSMIEELSRENLPIILDETFAYFDQERLAATLQYLLKKAEQHQVILLTCTNREIELLEKKKIPYHLIQL